MANKEIGDSGELAAAMVALVRSFGLHRPNETPCGRPIPVGEAHALMDLAGGPLNHGELASRLRLDRSTVTRLVGQLEKRGWIRRKPDTTDRRVVLISLTRKGVQAAGRLAAARATKFDGLLTGIPKAKQAQVLEALSILVRSLERS
jgi:DNA-binding MarR family transcriptional regulator